MDNPLRDVANDCPLYPHRAATDNHLFCFTAMNHPLRDVANNRPLHPHHAITDNHPLRATTIDHPLRDVANYPSTSASISVALNHKLSAGKTVQRKVGHDAMITSATFEAELTGQKEKNEKILKTRKRRTEMKEKRKNDKEKQASKEN